MSVASLVQRNAFWAPQPRINLSLSFTLRNLPTAARIAVLIAAGAMPVTSIPLYILGWLPMTYAALIFVIPLSIATVAMIWHRSPEAVWAARGIGAGLIAVFAYDAVRMPLVWTNIWPDFIPRLGGWITGADTQNALVGYTWRYLGDGAGIGLSFFVCCGVVLTIRPSLVTTRPVLLSIGYGVFVWTGLIATVVLPARGQEMLFHITPASFGLSLLGHLIYGSVLGLVLRRIVLKQGVIAIEEIPVSVVLPSQRSESMSPALNPQNEIAA
jgi:hypothetical protein